MIIETENFLEYDLNRSVKNLSLSQKAYILIRWKIISLELPPGAVIDEAQLQSELGLGRTPIREALQRLSLEQLVSIVPRRGIFVTEIGITDLIQLFEVRLNLEAQAGELAARRGTPEHWRRMGNALNNLPKEYTPEFNERLIAIDEYCHNIIYEATGNKFLQSTLTTLYALSLRLWFFFLARIANMQAVINEHKLILEALEKGDAQAASQLVKKHIHSFQEEVQAAMLGETVGG